MEKRPTIHRMTRRAAAHDYSAPGIYHITLHVAETAGHPFGHVVGDPLAPDGTPLAPRVVLSHTGQMVEQELLHSIPAHYPMIEIQDHVIMPEHIHFILEVHDHLVTRSGKPAALGHVIAGFKKGCNRRYWEMTGQQETIPQGASMQGAAEQGAAMQGAARQGAAMQGAAMQGAAEQGAARQGASMQGAARQGAAMQGAAQRGKPVGTNPNGQPAPTAHFTSHSTAPSIAPSGFSIAPTSSPAAAPFGFSTDPTAPTAAVGAPAVSPQGFKVPSIAPTAPSIAPSGSSIAPSTGPAAATPIGPAAATLTPATAVGAPAVSPQGFKVPSTASSGRQPLFAPGYCDVMPLHRGQLATQRQYIKDNPRSRLLRSSNRAWLMPRRGTITTQLTPSALCAYLRRECPPHLVTPEVLAAITGRLLIIDSAQIAPAPATPAPTSASGVPASASGVPTSASGVPAAASGDPATPAQTATPAPAAAIGEAVAPRPLITCDTFGNPALLTARRCLPVVCHRKDAARLGEQMARCKAEAARGAVLVSARIAPGEQTIIDALVHDGFPVVIILDNGLPDRFHPSADRLDLCAADRLLLITPWQYRYRHAQEAITVPACKTMNCVAQALCRTRDSWWKE